MDTFNKETYFDPLYYALRGDESALQPFVDAVLDQFNRLEVEGFTWDDDLLDDFTFEQVERYYGIAPLAAVVDPDSPAIPFAREGEVLGTGKIPRMKTVDYLNEAKIRTIKKLVRRNDVTPERISNSAGAAIGGIFIDQTASFVNALTFQRDQMVSTGGIVYNATNNPYGIALSLSARVPSANTTNLTGADRWWTAASYAAEGANADPVADMKAMVENARQKGVVACHFEINNLFLDKILGHSKVQASLLARLSLSARMTVADLSPYTRDELIAALAAIVGKPIRERKHISSVEYVEKGVKKTREFNSFATDVVVLVPDGNIGTIKTVEPMLLEGGKYAFGFGGKLAFTIGQDFVKKCQSYGGEMTSLCTPDKPRVMWYLKPCNV